MARIQLYCMAVVLCFLAGLGQVQMQQFSDAQVNAAIRSPRYMRRQINCLLGETNCDTVGNQMKRVVPSLLRGQCPGCTPQQHAQAARVMTAVSQQYPAEYSRIYFMYGGAPAARGPGK